MYVPNASSNTTVGSLGYDHAHVIAIPELITYPIYFFPAP
jgi:hypothetical protein